MPTERARKRAKQDKKQGKSPSTQAGEYVREEMHKLKRGGGRAKNPRQAIAIGLSEARRDGVAMPGPGKRGGKATAKQTSAKKSTAKKTAAKRSPSKHSATKKSGARKSSAKRSNAKRTSRKRGSR